MVSIHTQHLEIWSLAVHVLAMTADGPLLLKDVFGILRLSSHIDSLMSHEESAHTAILILESAWVESFFAVSH